MLNLSRPHAAALLLLSSLTLTTLACTQTEVVKPSSPGTPSASPAPTAPVSSPSSQASPSPTEIAASAAQNASPLDPGASASDALYEEALNRGAGAFSISQSAQSSDDWSLVASRWQDAIALLDAVPEASKHKTKAREKAKEYQRNLAVAQKRAASPVIGHSTAVAKAPRSGQHEAGFDRSWLQSPVGKGKVFRVPIKRRSAGTPVIDVLLNGEYKVEMIVDTGASGTVITRRAAAALGVEPVGVAKADTASAKGVKFYIGILQSLQVGGAVYRNLPVAIAGPELNIGLLGHDFFGGYDITIKRDAIEFRVR